MGYILVLLPFCVYGKSKIAHFLRFLTTFAKAIEKIEIYGNLSM